jgi:hypothetical protein
VEDNKTMDQAKRANDARKTLKEFKARHGQDLYKGEDARSHKAIIDKKTQKLMAKTREEPKNRAVGKGRSFSDKSMAKIQAASRPTKSKMIIKSGGGGGRGGKGGGRGGRGGSSSRGSSRGGGGGRGGSRGGRK